jgi:hypothetical protein
MVEITGEIPTALSSILRVQSSDFFDRAEIVRSPNADAWSDFHPGTTGVMIALTIPAVTNFTGCGS